METIHWKSECKVPVIIDTDVVVIGGGPGGLGAAVMSAKLGTKTTLIERYGVLGGMASVGEVQPFMGNHVNDLPLDFPVYGQWVRKIQEYLPEDRRADDSGIETISPKARIISKECAALAAEDLCLEAGVEILYHHQLFDTIMDGREIKAVLLLSKSGLVAVKAKRFIDCTGDGDLAAEAGCEFEYGGADGLCQPMTTCFKLAGVERPEMELREWRKVFTENYLKAREAGEIDCPRDNVLCFLRHEVAIYITVRRRFPRRSNSVFHHRFPRGHAVYGAYHRGVKPLSHVPRTVRLGRKA